jgi:hypothetical protein
MIKAVLPPTHPKCGVTAGMVSARIMNDYTTAAGSIYHYLPSFSQAYPYTTTTKFAHQRKGSTRIRREGLSLISVYGVRLLKGGHDISVTQPTYVSRVHARNPLLSPTLLSLAFAFDLGTYTLRTT